MAPRATRSRGAAVSVPVAAPASSSKYTLPAESGEPPKLFILPKRATADARIVTLPHPRYAARPTRYLVCPETGMYEFTRIACPATTPRSWMIEAEKAPDTNAEEETMPAPPASPQTDAFPSLITKSADLYVASPVDPLFLVLPALAASSSAKRMFLATDDHLDALPPQSSHLADLLRRQPRVRRLLEARIAAVCDTVEAGDEPMFRLNEDRLLRELLAKAGRMATHLPCSMEERFVAKVLEAPVLSIQRENTGAEVMGETTRSTPTDSGDSSTATDATITSTASTSTSASSIDPAIRTAMQASDDVVALQRLRVALDYICSSYVPPALTTALKERLSASTIAAELPDFAPLDAYLSRLAAVKQEVTLARSAALDYSHKRGLDEDEDEDDRTEKRRKREEEERRRKASASRGVRDLKKVNVSGMKKLSEFFKKK
ncbi:hypothetical protein CMQ_6424 [Grosmannia clavigera kw1407]|uniref:Ribonuclease H2 subunit B n=1 Tax=Grosmannia clavigera (strain kw1407 / UAMH 11150) TaxID=655863 RepID=F0XMN2_GROCL|nr:uncharacterized protein CMQ_6424 [Grosmannia clavigera kw1407]EFX01482.1 hypothetical protein CMQ_6424 [Grosmannia clavigera kw1407]